MKRSVPSLQPRTHTEARRDAASPRGRQRVMCVWNDDVDASSSSLSVSLVIKLTRRHANSFSASRLRCAAAAVHCDTITLSLPPQDSSLICRWLASIYAHQLTHSSALCRNTRNCKIYVQTCCYDPWLSSSLWTVWSLIAQKVPMIHCKLYWYSVHYLSSNNTICTVTKHTCTPGLWIRRRQPKNHETRHRSFLQTP